MVLDMQEEQIDRYGLGEFGDVRLKKLVRCCMHGWSAGKQFVCGNWVKTVPEKFASVVSWPIGA